MPLRKRIKTTVPDVTTHGPMSADSAAIQEQFPGTPALNDYGPEAALAIYQEALSGVKTYNTDFDTGVDMDYGAAPAIPGDVSIYTKKGLANAFCPDPRSPGSHNANDMSAEPGSMLAWADSQKVEQFPIGNGGVSSGLDPATSSATISGRKVEDIPGNSGPTEAI